MIKYIVIVFMSAVTLFSSDEMRDVFHGCTTERERVLVLSRGLLRDFNMIVTFEKERREGLFQKILLGADESHWFYGRSVQDLFKYFFCACSMQRCKVTLKLLSLQEAPKENDPTKEQLFSIFSQCLAEKNDLRFTEQQKEEVKKAIAGLMIARMQFLENNK